MREHFKNVAEERAVVRLHDDVVGLAFEGEEIFVVFLELEREQGAEGGIGIDGLIGDDAGTGGAFLGVGGEIVEALLEFGVARFELDVEPGEFVRSGLAFDDRGAAALGAA